MVGIGTIVNTVAVLAGGGIGLFFKTGLKDRFKEILMQALGLSTIFIGISGALRGLFVVRGEMLDSVNSLLMILSLILGALTGELINIDSAMNRLGELIKRKAGAKDSGNTFVEGFVSSSLIICTGAMAIVGSFQDALLGDPSMLFAKSALDAVLTTVFASAFGVGVLFSALPLAVYQGSLTILAQWIKPILTEEMISNLSFVGSLIVFLIGINLLFDRKIRVGNFLPALLFAVLLPLVFKL
jgi:uncharacterized membrane protein YqgA involved in biofilm formation